MNDRKDALLFTGERFTPECEREIWYEHWHRYVFARPFAQDKRVLDVACGEGYGSALLAEVAAEVVGVDIDEAALQHARTRYGKFANLHLQCGNAESLQFEPGRFDLVVSFETLEHVEAQQALIEGLSRVLSDDGLLIVSSPDKHAYTDVRGFRNEFHVRELYRDELLTLLKREFPHVRLLGQKLLFQSAIWALDGGLEPVCASTQSHANGTLKNGLAYEPLYFVALCSKQPLNLPVPGLSLFGDDEETVYAHYNGEVRRNMSAGQRIQELEAELAELKHRSSGAEAPLGRRPASIWRHMRRWFGR